MQDALLASIATFHTKKIILSDLIKFPHYGMIPETMKLPPIGLKVLSPEQQAALDALEKPTNRGKRVSKKEDPEEHEQSEEEEVLHVSPREPTPPRSPTPPESPKHNRVPTPIQSPKQTVPLSVPIVTTPLTTPATTLPSSPPITTVPISTVSISSPLITESTTTTIPKSTVEVNVSDTGATTATTTPIDTKLPSPTQSNDSGATLGGDDEEFDSIYYSPYRLQSDDETDAPVSCKQIQGIHEKLDRLLADSKAYGGVVLKAFLETTIEQYTQAIDNSTKAVNESTSTSHYQSSVDSFSKSLHDETTKFEAVCSELKTETTSFLHSVDSRFDALAANLATEGALKEDLAKKQATIDVQKVQLAQAEKEISLLKVQRATEDEEPKVSTEPKVNLASGSSSQSKHKGVNDESESDVEETIADALIRKKRNIELDETMKVVNEAEEQEKRTKEEKDVLQCKKALFPEWNRDTLINQAIDFPSVYLLEPVALFDCDNSKDS
ncbi:uncharacterized protein LOC111894938 [Lactuca sativa]|uniref:uncharacterized protein LOC111894938 n=1 Tax=Lactuca sativa TaxID=4236 RepID=UPI000CD9528F|nr:uncharacterized protein LOC111894938 [Lactuca sativa]